MGNISVQEEERKNYDILEKDLEDYPDVFSDIINVFVYQGEKVLNPENLRPAALETRYKDIAGKLKRQTEDIGKYEEIDGETRVLFLLANQSTVDRRMILRKCGYTGGHYRGQYNRQERNSCPVMELVLYWGRRRWNGAHSIRNYFGNKQLSEKVWNYIDDQKLYVFEMRHLPREVIEKFTSDMRIVLEYLADDPDKSYLTKEIVHTEALLELLHVLSEDNRYRELIGDLKRTETLDGPIEGGRWKMCKLIDEFWEKGRKEGIQQGIQQGMQQGIQVLVTTCRELGATFEETSGKLKEKFSLPDADVQKEMELYW